MPPVVQVTSDIAYVRFHGRNKAKWWRHRQAYERYDYSYAPQELAEWVPRINDMTSCAGRTFVFLNNHYRGKSAENARMFSRMLGIPEPSSIDDDSPPRLPFEDSEL